MPPSNQYITGEQFGWILKDLNYDTCETRQQQELLDRATGDLEADLSEKFVVPLINADGGAYSTCQQFARNKVLNAMKAKVREVIGYDKNRNLMGTIDSTQKYINVHGDEYKTQIKGLLKSTIDFGFKLLSQAEDAQTPVQHLGLARANNKVDPFDSGDPFR